VGAPQRGADPRKIDSASPAVLKEDGFSDYEVATYKHDERAITVESRTLRGMPTGAYAGVYLLSPAR